MLTVRDIMTHNVVSIAENAPLDVAAWILVAESVSGAPVRDSRGNLVGVLSRTDLSDPRRAPDRDSGTVADAMTPGSWAVHPDAPILEAVQLMLDHHIHRVLVVAGPGQLVGIVSTTDILRALVDGRFIESAQSAHSRGQRDPDQGDEVSDEIGEDAGEHGYASQSS